MMLSPIDRLIDKSGLRCTKCDATAEQGCDCWEPCSCGWTAEKGLPCNNQKTTRCSTKAKFFGFRSSRKARGWKTVDKAVEDGELCALRFKDAEGYFESDGPFFLHDGCWYFLEPPRQMEIQPVSFKKLL